ncbi:hypothetical protein [Pseudomonas yamanorum]|uniref:hypothetical protein n=1 Tax=Pseudomonas yamanorum TaxID=515393 RepID=UPI003D35F196
MQHNDTRTEKMSCRQLALEQNQKLFDEANALSFAAADLLEHPDFDSEMFDEYLRMRGNSEALFREAIEHLGVLNEHFPPPTVSVAIEGQNVAGREKKTA